MKASKGKQQAAALVEPWTAPAPPHQLAERLLGLPGLLFLDSAGEAGEQGRWSFLLADPALVLTAAGGNLTYREREREERRRGGFFEAGRELLRAFPLAAHPEVPFVGGLAGYWGYELEDGAKERRRDGETGRRRDGETGRRGDGERRPGWPRSQEGTRNLPDGWAGIYDALYAFDHLTGRGYLVSSGTPDGDPARREARLEWLRERLAAPAPSPPDDLAVGSVTASHTRESYRAGVRRVLEYIAAGDIYQANLSQRFRVPVRGHPWALYRRLRQRSPAPFAAYLDAGDHQVLSSSPERFLLVRGREVETRPIKGTRPRGADPAADAALARELLASSKDRAELVMIVDLERNDLGRVCEYGSVRVPTLFALESYANVHHLVATVRGRLREEVHPLACLRACFPGGSITGAPKIRAMEIIEELEPEARHVYTGALGYCGFDGNAEWNIAIRTMTLAGGEARFSAGGGIVADSDPDAEYDETLAKARGMLAALGGS